MSDNCIETWLNCIICVSTEDQFDKERSQETDYALPESLIEDADLESCSSQIRKSENFHKTEDNNAVFDSEGLDEKDCESHAEESSHFIEPEDLPYSVVDVDFTPTTSSVPDLSEKVLKGRDLFLARYYDEDQDQSQFDSPFSPDSEYLAPQTEASEQSLPLLDKSPASDLSSYKQTAGIQDLKHKRGPGRPRKDSISKKVR